LIALRRANAALEIGSYATVATEGDLLAYIRAAADRRFLIALNLGSQGQTLGLGALSGRVILSTLLDRRDVAASGTLALRAVEGVIVELV
jgi:alpha-glucosidase